MAKSTITIFSKVNNGKLVSIMHYHGIVKYSAVARQVYPGKRKAYAGIIIFGDCYCQF